MASSLKNGANRQFLDKWKLHWTENIWKPVARISPHIANSLAEQHNLHRKHCILFIGYSGCCPRRTTTSNKWQHPWDPIGGFMTLPCNKHKVWMQPNQSFHGCMVTFKFHCQARVSLRLKRETQLQKAMEKDISLFKLLDSNSAGAF